jgi:hypothetical protein
MTNTSVTIGSWTSTGTDAYGVKWTTRGMTGFEDTAPARIAFPDRAGADGGVDQRGFKSSRVLTWQGIAVAPDRLTREAAKHRLRAAAGDLVNGVDVTVHLQDGDYLVHGKQTGGAPWQIAPFGPNGFQYQAFLTCPDPLLYSAAQHSASASLLNTTGLMGFNFPATFPLGFSGGGVGAGQMVATNNGTEATWPLFTITGPGTHLLLSDQASGSYLEISTLNTGEFVVLDPRNKAVLLMGYQSRRDLLESGSDWFTLPSGLDVVTFSAATFTSATVSMTWRDAY